MKNLNNANQTRLWLNFYRIAVISPKLLLDDAGKPEAFAVFADNALAAYRSRLSDRLLAEFDLEDLG